jgi:hypothetical protein
MSPFSPVWEALSRMLGARGLGDRLAVACGASRQVLPPHFSPDLLTVATLKRPAHQALDRMDVPARRLAAGPADAGVERIGPLKTDVEGWEPHKSLAHLSGYPNSQVE